MLNLLLLMTQRKFRFTVMWKIKFLMSREITYRITCPGCGGKCIRKSERCLISCMNKHGTRDTEPLFKHLSECEMFKETCNLNAFSSLYNESDPKEIFLTSHMLTLFRMAGTTSFSPVSFTNVRFSPQNFLTFIFNPFTALV